MLFGIASCAHQNPKTTDTEPAGFTLSSVSAEPTHCRTTEDSDTAWKIRPITVQGIASSGLNAYYVVEDHGGSSGGDIAIALADRIRLSASGSDLLLEHRRNAQAVASAVLQVQGAHALWASGRARLADNSEAGDYFVYLLRDSTPCRHPQNNAPGSQCRSVLIEYFDDDDLASASHRPVLEPDPQANVLLLDGSNCATARQSDNGEGDEGPP